MAGKPRQADVLIAALAAGQSVVTAAKMAGCSPRTVFRRLDDPEFVRAVAQARAGMASRTVGNLATAGVAAARTLRRLLTSPSDAVKLSAARSILEIGARLREASEIEARIVELEHQVAALPGAKGRRLTLRGPA